ncbi:MAG: hypothetical protein WCX74_04160 [Candidatus Paceibacterota bacterium]
MSNINRKILIFIFALVLIILFAWGFTSANEGIKIALIGLGGALIGGAISAVAQFINRRIEMEKWKKEKKIEILLNKRNDIKELCDKYESNALESSSFEDALGMLTKTFNQILIDSPIFPDEVNDEFLEIMKEINAIIEENEDDNGELKEKIQETNSRIARNIKKCINIIDRQIEKEINEI